MGNQQAKKKSISCRKILETASCGDIILIRQSNIDLLGVDESVVRGIAATTQEGKCFSIEKRTLPLWTKVVLLFRQENNHRLDVLNCTAEGIELIEFESFYNTLLSSRPSRIVFRKVRGDKRSFQVIQELNDSFIRWSDLNQEDSRVSNRPLFLKLMQHIRLILSIGLKQLPMEQQVEINRAFCTVDVNGDGKLDPTELDFVATELMRQNMVQMKDMKPLMEKLKRNEEPVTLDQFTRVIQQIPISCVPLQTDSLALVNGALAGAIYTQVGILREKITRPLYPESFSSSSTHPFDFFESQLRVIN